MWIAKIMLAWFAFGANTDYISKNAFIFMACFLTIAIFWLIYPCFFKIKLTIKNNINLCNL